MQTPVQSRRDFIRTAALAAASAPLAGSLISSARAQAPDRKLGFALVGLGSLSTGQIAPALQKTQHCRLAGIVTGTPAKAEKWKARYNIPDKNIYNYETMGNMADNPDIDVVYVVTPNALHAEHTIKAAKAGKHVLTEKPMEVSVAKCQSMIDACNAAGKMLAVGYRCHFEPNHLECVRMAREKVFGEVKLIEAAFGFRIGDPGQWRLNRDLSGGGALMDVGIYALQAARYLSGQEPVEVSAMETKTDPEKFKTVDESIAFQLRFPGGVLAQCRTTYNANGMNEFTVYGADGSFGLGPAFNYTGNHGHTTGRGGPGKEFTMPEIDQFAAEMDNFAQCIINNTATSVPGEEGLRDIKIMMAIYDSIKKGAPVSLS